MSENRCTQLSWVPDSRCVIVARAALLEQICVTASNCGDEVFRVQLGNRISVGRTKEYSYARDSARGCHAEVIRQKNDDASRHPTLIEDTT